MMRCNLGEVRKQAGFTLIEVLVAMAITGFIGTGVAMSTAQVINVNSLSNNHMVAIKQVENAAYWLGRDVRMSQTIQPGGGSGFPLNLSWVEWDNTTWHISYTLVNNVLQRSVSINGTPPNSVAIAQHISVSAGDTNCQYSNGVFNYKLTATVNGFKPASETRLAEVTPRSAQ